MTGQRRPPIMLESFSRALGDSMNKSDIPFLSASELSRLMADKEVSPVEAAEAYLERIESLNGKLHAYLTVTADEALKAAKLGNVESVDDFVESCLLNEVDYVRRTLSSLPADWYKHDWAVAALLERGRKTRERFAAAKAEAEAQATNEAEE